MDCAPISRTIRSAGTRPAEPIARLARLKRQNGFSAKRSGGFQKTSGRPTGMSSWRAAGRIGPKPCGAPRKCGRISGIPGVPGSRPPRPSANSVIAPKRRRCGVRPPDGSPTSSGRTMAWHGSTRSAATPPRRPGSGRSWSVAFRRSRRRSTGCVPRNSAWRKRSRLMGSRRRSLSCKRSPIVNTAARPTSRSARPV